MLDATRVIRPYLRTRYWLSLVDLSRSPVCWRDVARGFGLQAACTAVFLGFAWASFATTVVTG